MQQKISLQIDVLNFIYVYLLTNLIRQLYPCQPIKTFNKKKIKFDNLLTFKYQKQRDYIFKTQQTTHT